MQTIITTEQVEKIRKLYLDDKKPIDFIRHNSLELLGKYFGYNSLKTVFKRYNIQQRSMSESISIGSRTLNYDISHLSEGMIEWFDGFLLGDGSLRFSNSSFKDKEKLSYARISMASSQIEWAEYAVSEFKPYFENNIITTKKYVYENNPKNPNPLYVVRSLGHPDIVRQVERWYPLPETNKIIPQDIRITPTSVMLWYLGDGSLVNNKSVKFAVCGFSDEQINELLIKKLEDIGIHSYLGHWRQYAYIWVRRNSIGKFFDFIGYKSPIKCYDYKFNYDKMYSYKRLCDIVKDKRELWRSQWFCKNDLVEYTRMGKFFLFDNEQAQKLRDRLNQHNSILFSEDDMERISDLYISGSSIPVIAKQEGQTPRVIRRVLVNKGVQFRNAGQFNRRYNVDHDFFCKIDSADKAYIFGYLLADGYNCQKRNSLEMSCSAKDRDILEKINERLNSTYRIKEYNIKGNDYCRLFINSNKMCQDLADKGCVQNKTFDVEFMDFGELQSHFIRGFFDGDGCFSYSFAKRDNCYGNSLLAVVTFTSTLNFCNGLKQYILDNLGINATMLCRFPERNNNIRTLQIAGNTQVIKLMRWMQNDAGIYLQRKLDKFNDFLEELENRKNGKTHE